MNKKTSLWIILGLTMLNAIGLTIVLPLFPFLLGEYVPDAQVAITLSLLVSVFAVCQFLAAPFFGSVSDRYGRKPVLILSLFGSAIGYVLLGVGGALWILFLGRIIDGLTAGNQSTLFASVADITEHHERSKWYGYVGGAHGLGFMIGPAIGGLLGTMSVTLPFFVAAVVTLLASLCAFFLLPESLPKEKRTTHLTFKSLNTFGSFKEIFSFRDARALLITGGFFYAGLIVWQFNTSVFLKDVYLWGPALVGGIYVAIGICDILSRVVLLPQMLKIWSDRTVGMIGLAGLALGLALLFLSAYVMSIVLIALAVACIVLGEGLFDPTYNGRLSFSVPEHAQGKLQGTSQSLQALYRVLVPLGAGAIYTYSHSGVFLIGSASLCVGFYLFSRLRAKV